MGISVLLQQTIDNALGERRVGALVLRTYFAEASLDSRVPWNSLCLRLSEDDFRGCAVQLGMAPHMSKKVQMPELSQGDEEHDYNDPSLVLRRLYLPRMHDNYLRDLALVHGISRSSLARYFYSQGVQALRWIEAA